MFYSVFPFFDNIRHTEIKRKLPCYSDAIRHYYLGKVPHSFLSLIEKHQREKLNFFGIAYQLLGKVAISKTVSRRKKAGVGGWGLASVQMLAHSVRWEHSVTSRNKSCKCLYSSDSLAFGSSCSHQVARPREKVLGQPHAFSANHGRTELEMVKPALWPCLGLRAAAGVPALGGQWIDSL